jgi:hypothetical protein
MTETLSRKDYLLLSAYLDGELPQTELQRFEKRLLSDQQFKRTLEELAYTKRLLRAMPRIRAPRNFMLTPERVKKTARRQIFQPAWGLVSAVSTFLLLMIFAGTSIIPRLAASRAAVPEMASLSNDAALSQESGSEVAESPMIILWNPQRAYGMGGGGGDGNDPGLTTIKGAPETAPAEPVTSPDSQTTPPDTFTTEQLQQADPSTMILGIPDEESQGTNLTESLQPRTKFFDHVPPMTLLMMVLGLITLVSTGLALLLRRR